MKYLLLLCPLVLSCADNDFPRAYKLDRLRVIELIASAPEAVPGDTVTVTPYVSDYSGGGRALNYEAFACVDPGIAYGASPNCDNNATRVVLQAATNLPGLTAPTYTGAAPNLTVVVPSAAVMLTGRPGYVQFNGVIYLVTYRVFAADGTSVSAFRRILVSNKTPKNQNPATPDIRVGTVILTALPASETSLNSFVGAASLESYQSMRVDGSTITKTEEMRTNWYVTEGSMKFDNTVGTADNPYNPPGAPVAGRNVIIAVTADGRAGSSIRVLTY